MTLYIFALDRSLAFVAPVRSLSDETAAFAPSCSLAEQLQMIVQLNVCWGCRSL
jgi:hypothetical protein